jgi:hypothetical protein
MLSGYRSIFLRLKFGAWHKGRRVRQLSGLEPLELSRQAFDPTADEKTLRRQERVVALF